MNPWSWLPVSLAVLLVACLPEPADPIDVSAFERQATSPCDFTRDADFEGAAAERFERYARHLSARAALPPGDVTVAIVKGQPEFTARGVAAAEISCGSNAGDPPYRITLYRDALAGRSLATAYHTVAHELQHVVQIRRDGLPCGPPEGTRDAYEREAELAADRLVTRCR